MVLAIVQQLLRPGYGLNGSPIRHTVDKFAGDSEDGPLRTPSYGNLCGVVAIVDGDNKGLDVDVIASRRKLRHTLTLLCLFRGGGPFLKAMRLETSVIDHKRPLRGLIAKGTPGTSLVC